MTLSALLFLLGLTVVFVGVAAAGILWAIRSGQYDDMDGPAQRILMDDDDPMIPFNRLKQPPNQNKINPSVQRD
jgi:cbb3-type cytochrome oxidase maturation protein